MSTENQTNPDTDIILTKLRDAAGKNASLAGKALKAYAAGLSAFYGTDWAACTKGDKSPLGVLVEAERVAFVAALGKNPGDSAAAWQNVKKNGRKESAAVAKKQQEETLAAMSGDELKELQEAEAAAKAAQPDPQTAALLKMLGKIIDKVQKIEAATFVVLDVEQALLDVRVLMSKGFN